ncbi:MAG: hypothetical protein WEB89_08850 [Balneolales bacterium]
MPLPVLFVVILASVHVFANKINFLHTLSKSKWLSLAGGISIAFVFVHILPELHSMQAMLQENEKIPILMERYLYIVSLAGVLLFYSLEQTIIHFKIKNVSNKSRSIEVGIFWWHIGIFAAFNMLIGYYVHHEQETGVSTVFTYLALGFHFLINDYALLQHHEKKYHDIGRWIMAGAVVAGWVMGIIFTIPDVISSALFALVAGAIVVNSFKEELPEDKENNYVWFMAGATIYTVLLIL